MNSPPPLSVVMVVCNVERFLAESIESILTQSFAQFEFIVVDFGSTDDSCSIISSYAAKDSRLKIHTIPHCSLAEARNTGCFLAQGRYFAIMDADDVSTPNRLKLEFEFMERNPEIGLVGGGTEWIDAAGRVLLRDNHFPAENHKIRAALLTESPFCQPTVLIRREAFIGVGGYRAAFAPAEDYDLWLRIAERFEVANLPRIVLKYRIHPGQLSVARWRSQALCAAGARAAALARKSGKPDPLEGVKEITSDSLKMLGVSEGLLQTTLARGYLSCVRNMCRAGQYSFAINAVESFRFGDFTHADTWVIAESYLWAARLYWQQRKFARSMFSAVHAVVKRPIILGRPIKRLAPGSARYSKSTEETTFVRTMPMQSCPTSARLRMHEPDKGHLGSTFEQARVQLGRRVRQFRDVLRLEGPRGITDRLRSAAAERLAPKHTTMPVRRADVLAADLSRPFRPPISQVAPSEPVVINWVVIPPTPRSGGYTTLFRIIRYLESHGYVNRVYFYNVYRGDHKYYEQIVRSYYCFNGHLSSLDNGMEDAHAVVATSWPTAYPIFNSRCAGKRFYFVQDFEPYFYPAGALSLLAENTYRMGFHAITIGRCFNRKLATDFGMSVDSFEYGCDTSRYYRLQDVQRSGVVFYARPEAPRRGCELGLMALEAFAMRRPDITIHIYGTRMGKLPFRFIDHGRIAPAELNRIYNSCYAGLSLSLTNVSLVAHEMLAAGCIPVVNDTVEIRTDLESPFVRHAPPYPYSLASELEAVATIDDFESLSRAASASVRSRTWDDAGAKVNAIFRRTLK